MYITYYMLPVHSFHIPYEFLTDIPGAERSRESQSAPAMLFEYFAGAAGVVGGAGLVSRVVLFVLASQRHDGF